MELASSSGYSWPAVLGTLIVLLVTVALLFPLLPRAVKGGARRAGNKVVLVGPCGSGKTALFYHLVEQREEHRETVTSLEKNTARTELKGTAFELVDCPGHLRLASVWRREVATARAVVFCMDSTARESVRAAADVFVELLRSLGDADVPIFLALTKSDQETSRSIDVCVSELEREVERARQSLAMDDAEASLGIEGKAFRLEDAPVAVFRDLVTVVKGGRLRSLEDFVAQQVGE